MGCGFSKQVEEVPRHIFSLPRKTHFKLKDTTSSDYSAGDYNPDPRPFPYYDREGIFKEETATLKPLPGFEASPGQDAPVLWAYPDIYFGFDYSAQNGVGGASEQDTGPHLIITDRDKKIVGLITYSLDERGKLIRAAERVVLVEAPSRRMMSCWAWRRGLQRQLTDIKEED
ncbi:hypothetical protein N7474_000799 [Penicillium riverlandense]|uniref:uncharacterized protein n=1 Tax=Penicillium riverlandense TaxID=1903569 RepID=UPI002549979B|nr:uncharacterized protein N7474_000799 [Penicillium riverlandense]KAJ5832488.1 hypothetical protein N7474_000799 [Penicillium riverlandense]